MLVAVNQSKHALYSRELFTWHKTGDASQHFEEVHNCPAVRGVSSAAYKDAKYKQKKKEEPADKLGFVQTSVFLQGFPVSLLPSSLSLPYASATALNKPAMLEISVCCDLTRVWSTKESVCQLFKLFQYEFAI